jgi:hypothetical protein
MTTTPELLRFARELLATQAEYDAASLRVSLLRSDLRASETKLADIESRLLVLQAQAAGFKPAPAR